MDYEKKYNEALKDVRAIYPNLKGDAKLAVEHAFPELAESEDERIRKELVEKISNLACGCFISQEQKQKFIAYLEKQKKPHYTKRNALFDKCVAECDPAVMKEVSDEIDEMLEKEQRPAEWSEEDENRLNAVVELLENSSTIHPNYSRRKLIIWLKSLRPSWKPSEAQMEALEYVIRDYREDSCNATANYLQEILDHLKNM